VLCPRTLRWKEEKIQEWVGFLPAGFPNKEPTITQLSESKFLLTGGYNRRKPSSLCFLLNTVNRSLQRKTDLPKGLSYHKACYIDVQRSNEGAAFEQLAFAVNRFGSYGKNCRDVFKYEIELDSWSKVASMPVTAYNDLFIQMLPVAQQYVYVFSRGGCSNFLNI